LGLKISDALYESARDALRELSDGQKLPSLKALKAERDDLVLAKNGQYESYQTARMEEKELQTICSNGKRSIGSFQA
jgi:hypothetical protein